MVKVSLFSRIFTDFNVTPAEILAVNYHRSIKGKINVLEAPNSAVSNAKLALRSPVQVSDALPEFSSNTRRAMVLSIKTDTVDNANIAALRRRNLPLPPQGQLTVLKADSETPLKGATLRRGDTHIIQLTAIGDFPTEPEIVFALKHDIADKPLTVKTNQSNQGDITVTDLSPATTQLGQAQRLIAQIVLYPYDTQGLTLGRKVVFYTAKIIDRLADEIYTIESDRFALDTYSHSC
ncbi:hypothetical protein WA1_18870 [Scytonema hofmannii PCC 7110]|uniref:Uncharacterized protein n=1 Tax=Scytonema hofmannii PCC 7110 TaxID=128403 RepID=A0A139XBN9_9CYAN|nr:hypothetical protein [Scytonema hofmannii]KYC42066.1 hypothetical protein WA1_18870 [Scytonema hofmannii PCC 7110]